MASPYAQARALGAFILVDRVRNQTVALGVVDSVPEKGVAAARPARRARLLASALGGGGIALLAGLLEHDLALAATLGIANVLIIAAIGRLTSGSE